MKTASKFFVTGLLIAGLAGPAALAQGVSEASGKVEDRAGNPVQGAVVTLFARSKPDVKYNGKTNKKGRYFVAGLFSVKEQELWSASVEAEGYVVVEAVIESRNVNKVLIGDRMEVKLGPGKTVPDFPIRPLGTAQLDWIVVPADQYEAPLVAGAPTELPQGAEVPEGQPEPQQDPWVQALTLAGAGRLEESVAFFAKAVEEAPGDAERMENFAKVLYQLERHDEAEAQARRAVEIDAARIDAHLLLYTVYVDRGDLESARAAMETALVANPDDPRLLGRLGYAAGELGDVEASIAAYKRITEVNPDNAEAWLVLANLLADAGRLGESEKAYQKVVDLDPDNAYQTYYNLGALIIKRENRTEADTRRAVDAFRRAWEIKPDYARACQELAYALIGLGDRKGALEALETYVASNPQAPEADHMRQLIGSLKK
jgi:tetratricopeptide (TPR) repeat protein